MWEAIRRNQRKSIFLVICMGVLLIGLGFCMGMIIDPNVGGAFGCLAAFVIWLILYLTAIAGGGQVILSTVNAHKIEKAQSPMLWNVVEEMTIASGLEKMPDIYLIEDDVPNAFAVGRNPSKASLAVTSGLLKRLNRDELQGVIAHEIGHVKNLDIRFMTLASVMMGAIVLLSDIFLRGIFRTTRGRSGGNDQIQLVFLVLTIALAILSPFMAQLLYFSCSRKREYLADASSACYTRYPEGLASALEKISPKNDKTVMQVSKALAPLYIVNPLRSEASWSLFSTHPATSQRVNILRNMAGAGFYSYEQAYKMVQGARKQCLDVSTLNPAEDMEKRLPSPTPVEQKDDTIARVQQVNDLLTGFGGYTPISCSCGLMIKIPPKYKHNSITCPKCGTAHAIGSKEVVPATENEPVCYERKNGGWETVPCSCGHTLNLSPAFMASNITCTKCNRKIEIIAKSQ